MNFVTYHYHKCRKFNTFIKYFRGARHGLTLSGKLRRIVAQEEQLLKENEINSGNAQNIFQTWIEVKKKKKKKHKMKTSESNRINNEERTNLPNAIDYTTPKNRLASLIIQEDYQRKRISKKKKKQQRARDEDLARSLSRLSTSNMCTADTDSLGFYGVQSSSKVIKKEKHRRKLHVEQKNRKALNNDKKNFTNGQGAKQNGRTITDELYATSDDSEKDIQTDPMVSQIKKIMSQYPNKKFKVEAEELTPFQKKQLQKSGLRIEFKSKKRERKRNRNRKQVEKIIKKMKSSMDFRDSENLK